ncbi:MAG: ribose 5-phosphate isomerase B [Spirochaetes bacterium]|nr:ribose 5-phosphate isomerase B [Spirochaetota bacterium]
MEKKKKNEGIPSNIDKRNYSPPEGRKRGLITGEEILKAHKAERSIEVSSEAIITPHAYDLAKEKNVKIIINKQTALKSNKRQVGIIKKIAISSDHGGYDLKEKLKDHIFNMGFMYKDYGTHSKESVDYPDFAELTGRAVASGECDMGIVIDGAGIGSAITANKIKGILAAVCHDRFTAKIAREHDNANILALGAKTVSSIMAKEITRLFLTTAFAGGRHEKRVEKIRKLEAKECGGEK